MDKPCRAQPGPVAGFKVTFSSLLSGHRGKRRDFPSRLPPSPAACPQMLRVAAPASGSDAKQLISVWLLQAASLHEPTVLMGKFPDWPLPEKRPEQELGQRSDQSRALLPPLLASPGGNEKHTSRCEVGWKWTPQTPLGLIGLGGCSESSRHFPEGIFWQDHPFPLGNFPDKKKAEIKKKHPPHSHPDVCRRIHPTWVGWFAQGEQSSAPRDPLSIPTGLGRHRTGLGPLRAGCSGSHVPS